MFDKKCSRCRKTKDLETDFYFCMGIYRSECKVCTIKKNSKRQKKTKPWRFRNEDPEQKKEYMRKYYADNVQKFAEYRKKLKEKDPDYYKKYYRRKKEKK